MTCLSRLKCTNFTPADLVAVCKAFKKLAELSWNKTSLELVLFGDTWGSLMNRYYYLNQFIFRKY